MGFELWLGFLTATVVVSLLPGPSMLLVIGHSIAAGPRRSFATILGVLLADATLLGLALLGIGAVIHASTIAFTTLKMMGAGYLVYLGIRQWLAPTQAGAVADVDRRLAAGRLFRDGLVTTLSNPKIIGFFLAFFPQFVVPGQSAALQFAVLGTTFLTVVFVVMAGYALLAGQVRRWVWSRRGRRLLNRFSGVTLIGAGVMTAMVRRT